jgi:hypothetical protein
MEKVMTEREKEEGKMIQDLIREMDDWEKELFRAYLKGARFVSDLSEAK